jgi:mannan endo-1,4-beta-mannosidase
MRRFAGVAAFLAVLLIGCSSSPASSPAAKPAAHRPSAVSAIISDGPLVGAYEPGVPDSWDPMAQFAAAIGAAPRIAVYYSGWNEKFRADFADAARRHGCYVLVQIEPAGVSLASIVAGDSDSYLRAYARAVRAFGSPVILSFGHEMNGTWYSWGAGHVSPSVFVAAWRHVVQVFRAEGASNAVWAWSVNSVNTASAPLRPWWPGASWVNLVGIDGYYYSSADTFGSVFGRTIAEIRSFSHAPVLITETAVSNNPDRDRQIRALVAAVLENRLIGLNWFDNGQRDDPDNQDWRLEDDPAALAAFRSAVQLYGFG